jgi:LPS-assembly lipoprotein
MWLSRTFVPLVLMALLLPLSACGFNPLYGVDKTGFSDPQAELATIRVGNIPDRLGQQVRNQLVAYLTPKREGAQKHYALNIRLALSSEGTALAQDESATRYNLQLVAYFELVSLASNKKVFSGQARSIAVFNVITSEYATLIARQDAERRAARDVAEELRTRLAVFFSRRTKAS